MPQEELTVKFFNRGAGVAIIKQPADLARIIADWQATPSNYRQFREDFLKLRYEEDPTLVVTELVDLAQQVSHTEYRPGPFPPRPRKA
jgi:processive 1,2-diacylglycerol beta-glucosyltransferase